MYLAFGGLGSESAFSLGVSHHHGLGLLLVIGARSAFVKGAYFAGGDSGPLLEVFVDSAVDDHVSDPEDGLNCDLPLGNAIEEDSDLTVDNGNEPEEHGEEQHDSTGDTPGPGEPVVLDLEIVESGSKDPEGNLRDGDEEASDPDPGVPSAGPVNHREATSADLRSGSGGAEGGRSARGADSSGDQGGTGGAG